MDHTADGHAPVIREEEAIQHPLGIYFKIWILLFVLSAMSYAVDYYQVQGYMRWFLILFFMVLKACLLYTSPSPRDRQKYRMPSSA